MTMKIGFYDDNNISPAAKRLIGCFNAAASFVKDARDAKQMVKFATDLYTTTTGEEKLPKLNSDEKAALSFAFVGIAAKIQGNRNPGWEPYSEVVEKHYAEIKTAAAKILS